MIEHQSNQTSNWTGHNTVILNYAAWVLDISFPRMTISRAAALAAWIDSLRGSYGTFYYSPRFAVQSAGVATNLAQNAFATSQVVQIGGWTTGAPTHLAPGQFIQIGSQLVRIVAAPSVAEPGGTATVEFNPPLRSNLSAGTTVETTNPRGLFRLDFADGDGSGYQVDPDRLPEFTALRAVEAL